MPSLPHRSSIRTGSTPPPLLAVLIAIAACTANPAFARQSDPQSTGSPLLDQLRREAAPPEGPLPLLPGLVGPAVESEASTTGTAAVAGARLVPPPAETWDRSIESVGRLPGYPAPPAEGESSPSSWLVGIAAALLVAAVALVTTVVAPRKPGRPAPVSILRGGRPDRPRS